MSLTSRYHPLVILLSSSLAVGCGGGNTVTGQVTVDGEPLAEGSITFRPQEIDAKFRGVQTKVISGRFEVTSAQGLPNGSYNVSISARRKTGRKMPMDEGSSELEDETQQYIPPNYNVLTKLTAEISGDTEGLLFELELSKQGKKRR